MSRYLKIFNGDWIDTTAEHDEYGRYYYVKIVSPTKSEVWYFEDEVGKQYYVGVLECQTDDKKKLAREYRKLYHYAMKLKEGGKAWERVMKKLDNIQGVVMYERKN